MPEKRQWEDDVAFALLEHPKKWRVRCVERIELSSHRWAVRNRKLHVKSLLDVDEPKALAELLTAPPEECMEPEDEVTIVLPLSQMTKNAVVDFEAEVNGKTVSRLSRKEGARLQARYFLHLVRQKAAIDHMYLTPELEQMLTAVFGATHPWKSEDFEKHVQEQANSELSSALSVAKTLEGKIKAEVVEGRVHPNSESAAQNPLLALPYLDQLCFEERQVRLNNRDFERYLEALRLLLDKLLEKKSVPTYGDLLKLYCEYGRHWEVFARCTVPLKHPFFIALSTKRHIRFEGPTERKFKEKVKELFSPVAWTLARFNDAESNHINIKIPDMNVELQDQSCEAYNGLGDPLNVSPSHINSTPELFAIYSSKQGREDRLWIKTPLRMARPTNWVYMLVIATIVATLAITGIVWGCFDRRLTAQQLALLLTPSTFAASLLLVRDSSPLSAKFTALKRGVILVFLCLLWSSALFLFVKGEIHVDEKKPEPKPSPTFIPLRTGV